MRKNMVRIFGILLLLCMVTSTVTAYLGFVDVDTAYAHSANAKVKAACNKATGQYDVLFSISSDYNLWATVTSMNPVLPGMPTSIPPKGTVSTTMSLPGNTSGNVTFSATIRWSDGFTDSDSGSDHLNGNCVMNTLTPTKTSTTTLTSTLIPTNTITLTPTEERKIPWCHFEPNGNSQTLYLPAAALQNAGHMDANGNPLHAGDNPGECIDPTNTATLPPTQTLTPTTEPTATATLVQCNWLQQILLGDTCVDFTNTPTIQPSATNTEAATETSVPTITDTVDPGSTPTLVESTVTTDPGTPTIVQSTVTTDPGSTPTLVESTVTTDPGTPVVDPTMTPEVHSTVTNVPKGPAEHCTRLLEGRDDQPRWQDNPRCVEYFKNAGASGWLDRILIWLFGS